MGHACVQYSITYTSICKPSIAQVTSEYLLTTKCNRSIGKKTCNRIWRCRAQSNVFQNERSNSTKTQAIVSDNWQSYPCVDLFYWKVVNMRSQLMWCDNMCHSSYLGSLQINIPVFLRTMLCSATWFSIFINLVLIYVLKSQHTVIFYWQSCIPVVENL